ncbi:MAG TPA: hypothetical protein VFA71_10945 [Terriglobales bacterium]|nr:hypothetical protein [Terriglobales bacterium]
MKPGKLLFVVLITLCAIGWKGESGEWRSNFAVDKKNLSATGTNPYFRLTPGLRLYYEKGKDTLVTTVLNETKVIDGVETRAVEDREMKNGQLIELTRDYYAIDRNTKDVYYFGEDVDVYKGGKIAGHEGSWLSGVKGAKFGMMMPGTIEVGQKFYQEQAPGVGMDRAEVVAAEETITTPAGAFNKCVHMKETSALEKDAAEHKWYAPGIGLVRDPEFDLIRVESK